MTEEEHTDDRTEERGTQSVPRFIVALGVVGVVALVAAVVAVVVTLSSAPSGEALGEAEEPIAGFTDSATSGVETGPEGSSAAELAAQADSDAEQESASVAVADDDATLQTLGAMPASTLGLLALPEGFTSAVFKCAFSPYGWGPGGPEGRSLVITVHSAEPVSGDTGGLADIADMNVSVWVEPTDIETVSVGGEFSGDLEVRRQGNVGALFLVEVTRR